MEDEGGGDGQKAGFRDRRLSVSQVPNESSPNRRLSVYADEAVNESAAQVLTHIATVSVKSVAGMEPVPGGSSRKINQVGGRPARGVQGRRGDSPGGGGGWADAWACATHAAWTHGQPEGL